MLKSKRSILACLIFVWILMLSVSMGQAQAQQKYPTKAIEVIVSWAVGGATDMTARVMADYLSKKWGVVVNVVNKPGGNAIPSLLELYNAKPDGYTVLQDGGPSSSNLIAVVQDPPFKIMDRTYIANMVVSPLLYIVRQDSPMKNMKDLEAEAKKDPGNFTWGSTGGGGGPDLAVRKFLKVIGVDVSKTKPIMSKGGSETVARIPAGDMKVGIVSVTAAGPAIDGKLVKALAVTTDKRTSRYPDVPTIAEAGYPAATKFDHYGPSGPPKLPPHIVETWEKAMDEMLKDPEVISKLNRIGQIPYFMNGRDIRELTLKEMEEIKDLLGIK